MASGDSMLAGSMLLVWENADWKIFAVVGVEQPGVYNGELLEWDTQRVS